jgi:energy-coupling factor transporter ATP-binding protein EcfA2
VTAREARGYLARFLFRGDDVFKEVRTLSGGERSRLELALLGIMPSNVLLLDEPTNHLDIGAREAIERFLIDAPATLLVVSHDRRLLETVCDRLWVVADGLAVSFEGGYRAWREAVATGWTPADAAAREAARLRPERASVGRAGNQPDGGGDAAPRRSAARRAAGGRATATGAAGAGAAGAGAATATRSGSGADGAPPRRREKLSKDAYRRRRAELDADLTRLGLRKNHLELALGAPNVQANFVELRRVSSELADVTTALRTTEDAWLELEDRAP